MRVFDTVGGTEVRALKFSPDGGLLAAAAALWGTVVHDLTSHTPPTRLGWDQGTDHVVIEFEPVGRVLVTLTRQGRTRFDPVNGTRLGVGPQDPDAVGWLVSFAGSADGARLVTVNQNPGVYPLTSWTAAGDGWVKQWSLDMDLLSDPVVSPAGDRVAVVGVATHGNSVLLRLLIYDTATGKLVASGRYGYSLLSRPLYRPDGRQIVAARDMNLLIWDLRAPMKPALVRNDSRRRFTAAAYHPSGRYLFTTSNDATVTVWDTDTWARVKRFDWDIGPLRAVAVSPDGLLAAAGSDRGRVVVWDVDV